jgi:peptide/nickel transport system ATP-binding protein
MENVLEVRNLTVQYSSGGQIIHAVNDVSFDLEKGSILALVGETGAGKTTIAKSMMRILSMPPAKITAGKISLEGRELLSLGEKDMLKVRGDKIAMIFQDPMTALNPLQPVGEQIEEGLLLHNEINKSEAREEAENLLEMVNIPKERIGEYPFQFSGGMKQRVVIAMALACNPVLLLADEPTTALDVTIQAQVLDLIRDLCEKNNTSMMLITHDLGVVAQTSDMVAVVYAGKIVEYGSKRDVFKNTAHPYTLGLFNSLPDMNRDSNRLKPIPGAMPDPTNLPLGCSFAARCPYMTSGCKEEPVELYSLDAVHTVRCFHPVCKGKGA